MITAGIDAGLERTKAVILKDGVVLGRGNCSTGGADRAINAKKALDSALKDACVVIEDVSCVIATGKGKYEVKDTQGILSEQMAAATATRYFCAEATSVVSIGADETMVATLGDGLRLEEYAFNMKCTAGLGLFLTQLSNTLGLTLEELGTLEDPKGVALNDDCVVFAELDALGLLNRGVDPKAIGAAAVKMCAVRANAVIRDITTPDNRCVILLGGLTRNAAFVSALKSISGIEFIVPEEAEYAGAIGAALYGERISAGG